MSESSKFSKDPDFIESRPQDGYASSSSDNALTLSHELYIRRIELETQNRELREMRNQLELSRNRYSNLYDFAPVSYIGFDSLGTICEINQTGAFFLQRSRAHLIGKPFHFFLEPKCKASFRRHIKTCLETQQREVVELTIHQPGLPPLCVELMTTWSRCDDLALGCLLSVMIDISKRKKVEAELESHREHLADLVKYRTAALSETNNRFEEAKSCGESIVDTLREPLLILDFNLKIKMANPAFYRTFRLAPGAVVGRFLHELGKKQWKIPLLVLEENKQVENLEIAQTFPRIGHRVLLLNACRLNRRSRDESLILLAIEDVTERRRLEREVLQISETERRRIGQDLHDGLSQHLAGTAHISQAIGSKLRALKMKEAASEVDEITQLVTEAITYSRAIAKGLCPVEMEEEGLVAAIRELATKTENIFKISCRVEHDASMAIRDHAVATHFYRIVQESIHNAVKHGAARNILVSLKRESNCLILKVRDDGRGFPKTRRRKTGMGLRIMSYRASVIGASIEIQKNANPGALLICSLEEKKRRGKRSVSVISKK